MSVLSRRAVGVAALLCAALVPSQAAAADTTAPSLTVRELGGVGRIANSRARDANSGITYWQIQAPGYASISSEDGTITWTDRDAITGRVLGRLTVATKAGETRFTSDDVDGTSRSGLTYLFPSAITPCTPTATSCGYRHRLPLWSLHRIDVQATDLAGNRSAVRTAYALVWPTLSGASIPYV